MNQPGAHDYPAGGAAGRGLPLPGQGGRGLYLTRGRAAPYPMRGRGTAGPAQLYLPPSHHQQRQYRPPPPWDYSDYAPPIYDGSDQYYGEHTYAPTPPSDGTVDWHQYTDNYLHSRERAGQHPHAAAARSSDDIPQSSMVPRTGDDAGPPGTGRPPEVDSAALRMQLDAAKAVARSSVVEVVVPGAGSPSLLEGGDGGEAAPQAHSTLYRALNTTMYTVAELQASVDFLFSELERERQAHTRALEDFEHRLTEAFARVENLPQPASVPAPGTAVSGRRKVAQSHPELTRAIHEMMKAAMGLAPGDTELPAPLAPGESERKGPGDVKLWNPNWDKNVSDPENRAFIHHVAERTVDAEKRKKDSSVPAASLDLDIAKKIAKTYFRSQAKVYEAQVSASAKDKQNIHLVRGRRRSRRSKLAHQRREAGPAVDEAFKLQPGTAAQTVDTDLCSDRFSSGSEWEDDARAAKDSQMSGQKAWLRKIPPFRSRLCTALYYCMDNAGHLAGGLPEAEPQAVAANPNKRALQTTKDNKRGKSSTPLLNPPPTTAITSARQPSADAKAPAPELVRRRWLKKRGNAASLVFGPPIPGITRGMFAIDEKFFARKDWAILERVSDSEGYQSDSESEDGTGASKNPEGQQTAPSGARVGDADDEQETDPEVSGTSAAQTPGTSTDGGV